MSVAAAAAPVGSEALQAEAFQRLYPDQYLAKFVAQGVRPDGRALALPRATSIGLGVVTTADASALVKIGSTSVLAGAKCEVMPASADELDKGRLTVQVGVGHGGHFRRQRAGGMADQGGGIEVVARAHAAPCTLDCRRRNARRMDDLTVPRGMPSSSEICWWDLASK